MYDALVIKGSSGLFHDERALEADFKFVSSQLIIAMNPLVSDLDRIQAGILGVGLGLAATPKAIKHYMPSGGGSYYNVNPARPFE